MVESASSRAGIEAMIKDTKVLIYSKSTCPFAGQTKSLLQQKGIDARIIELDQITGGRDMQNKLKDITGQGTVPNVFIGGKHIGGNSEL